MGKMNNLRLVPVKSLMDNSLKRIKDGYHFDSNLKPYRRDFLDSMIDFFLKEERYEDCAFLRDFIKKRFESHEERFRNI
jgi:hypothetical protein